LLPDNITAVRVEKKPTKEERKMRNFALCALLTVLAIANGLARNQSGPWSEWSSSQAEKILNDSPWSQVQVETNTSEMMYSPTSGSGGNLGTTRTSPPSVTMRQEQADRNAGRATEGAYNGPVSTTYQIRFLSARPVREALANLIVAKETGPNRAKVRTEMQEFVDRNYGDFVVITVSYVATDGRLAGKAFQTFSNAVAGTLKNNTYLERDDGQRAYLIDYRAPIDDGLGARFVFPRTVDGKPFVNDRTTEVRFYSEVSSSLKLNRRFKVSSMMYQGRLEY
jgi:hypothetical protein